MHAHRDLLPSDMWSAGGCAALGTPYQGTAGRRANAEALQRLGLRLLILGLLLGIFALRFKYLVLGSLAVSAIVFLWMWCVRPIHRLGVLVLLNFAYWFVSGCVSGGLTWASLVSSDFWRGEGRCFFFYLPLLAMSVLRVGRSELKFMVKTITILSVLGVALCGLWLLGYGHLFQAEEDAETGELVPATYFIGLLTSHTGAGAFWATVAAFLLAYSLRAQDRLLQVLAVLAVLLTLGTGGRAATLGLLAVLSWLVLTGDLLKPRILKVVLPAAVPIAAGTWIIAAFVPEVSERMTELLSARTFSALLASVDEPTLHEPAGHFYSGANLEHHNLVIRLFLWKYALFLFWKSPLVGIGFGRFNDTYLEFSGVPQLANLAVDGERYFGSTIRWEQDQLMTSTGNAHNSYLHMLAETGFLGLALFMALWLMLYWYCQPRRGRPVTAADRFEAAYCQGCRAMIVCLAVTALAGHALAAPSGGILLTTMVGAWIAYRPSPSTRKPPPQVSALRGALGDGRNNFNARSAVNR